MEIPRSLEDVLVGMGIGERYFRPQVRKQLIVLMQFGSHLYGTDTPESDLDYKGIYLPTREQILLGRIPKSYSYHPPKGEGEKNAAGDMDVEIYSLHYFLKLALEGQTVALDMLHAPDAWPVYENPIWFDLRRNRSKFYTKNMQAFIGYARQQAAKYGIKGSRLDAFKTVIDRLQPTQYGIVTANRLQDIWNALPEGEHIHKLDPNPHDKSNSRIYQVCGKKFMESIPIPQVIQCLRRAYDEYGARAKLARNNEGIDWKAVSHALRAAYQTDDILVRGDIVYPLAVREFLKRVKSGQESWEYVQWLLEYTMKEIEDLATVSDLPAKADQKWWNEWLQSTLMLHTFNA